MGLWRGKKGSSVFYKIKNSSNAQKQGIRERVYEVSNPQTNAQITQRMKLLPAQRVFGALYDIISRSWQGVEYGTPSRNAFLRMALKKTDGIPFLTREETKIIPGSFQISKGTLQEITTTFGDDVDQHATSIVMPANFEGTTVAAFSEAILNNNPSLQAGDQLTFVLCAYSGSRDEYIWRWYSFYLDLSNTALMSTEVPGLSELDGKLHISVLDVSHLVASAVIASRLASNDTYKRSSATLFVNMAQLDDYFNAAAQIAARRSYKKSSSASVDWPVEPDGQAIAGTIDALYTIEGITGQWINANGKQVAVLANENTGANVGVYVRKDGGISYLVGANKQLVYVTVGTGAEAEELPIPLSAISALSGLQEVELTEGD